jgi:serine/threonine-protein kinase HipA
MGQLAVWMNGELVGTWSNDHTHTFDYAQSWLQSDKVRPLSLSLPLTASLRVRGPAVESYFDNLLPDNEAIRKRIRSRFGAKSIDAFELLAAIGRDCVGAVQLLPIGEEPSNIRKVEGERLGVADIERILREVPVLPAFGSQHDANDFRISIAGAQEKTALLYHRGKWFKPQGTTPTTHILKLPLGNVTKYDADFSTSVENEWLCAQIVHELGLDVASSRIGVFGQEKVLVVERFDREWVSQGALNDHYLIRLPQEDLCQATATPPGRKYESDKGPGMRQCLDILGNSEQPSEARLHFMLSQLAFWLLAALDGHAKNFSIFIKPGGTYTATPLYDVLSAWPVIGKGAHKLPYQEAKLAMAVRSKNVHYKLGEIETRHWHQLGLRTGGEDAWATMCRMVEEAHAALERVETRLPVGFPEHVWASISAGTRRHAKKFLQGL